jgi:DinB superfamily
MPETAEQYKQRLFSYVDASEALRSQAAAPKKLAQLIRGVPRRRLMKPPAPGKWSIGEILAHLAECELVIGYRIRKILEENGTPIQAFDQDKWASAGNYAARDPRASLELFAALRKANLSLVKSLKPAQWKQFGLHAERGAEDIARIVHMDAGHDINHIKQIERILGHAAK